MISVAWREGPSTWDKLEYKSEGARLDGCGGADTCQKVALPTVLFEPCC